MWSHARAKYSSVFVELGCRRSKIIDKVLGVGVVTKQNIDKLGVALRKEVEACNPL